MIYRYKWEIKLWIAVIAYIVWVSVEFGWQQIHGDDNENDLGLCLNYHVQVACDRVEIEKIYKDMLNVSENYK